MYKFKINQWLPINIEKAWDFFSSPGNLSLITPPEMDFKILSQVPDAIYEGLIIDYKVRPLLGIAVNWQTEICDVQDKISFTDRQLKGPYRVWEHTHTFTEVNNGVLISDELIYQLPYSLIGRIAHLLFIKNKIKNIFRYRKTRLSKIFG